MELQIQKMNLFGMVKYHFLLRQMFPLDIMRFKLKRQLQTLAWKIVVPSFTQKIQFLLQQEAQLEQFQLLDVKWQ